MSQTFKAIIVILLLPICSYAQTAKLLTGKIKAADGHAVIGAVVILVRMPDSTVVQHTTTDEMGHYSISVVPGISAVLKVEAAGFTTTFSPVPDPLPADMNITMKELRVLSEVTVSSSRPVVEYKADRTVFNVENSIAATGGDALDALRRAPGIIIMNNQVTIAGKSSVSVMLNGRLQQMSGEDLMQFLRNIQADNLSKIEIITTPPAKYDAEGNAGIINLVTKKNLQNGVKGNVAAYYRRNSFGTPTLGATLNYRQDRLNVSGSLHAGISAWKYTSETNTYFPGQRWEQQVSQGSFNKNLRPTAGVEFALGKRSVLGIQTNIAVNRIDNTEITVASAYRSSGGADSNVKTTGNTVDIYRGKYSVNLNYELKLDSAGKKLNADADYYSQKGDRTRTFDVTDRLPDGTLLQTTHNRMRTNPDVIVRSAKADMEYPAGLWRLNCGFKVSSVTNTADNLFEAMQGATFVVDVSRTNSFSYTEQIQAAYLSTQRKVGSFDLQAGLRGEHTHTAGFSSTLAQTTERDYTNLFPSAYISYSRNTDHAFSLSFNRRINRPSYGLLNPFRFYYTPVSYSEGNVNLQPSISHTFELRYVLKTKYSFKVIGNRATDYWDRIFVIDSATNSSSISTRNIGNTWYLGANINGSSRIGKQCEISGSLNGGYSNFVPYTRNVRAYDGINAWLELNGSVYLNKARTLLAEASGYYYTPRQKDYKRWEEISCINLGIRWMLLDKNLVFTLSGNDLLGKAYWLQINMLNGAREYSYDDERCLRFSATYRFGNNNLKGKRDRGNIEEIQRAN